MIKNILLYVDNLSSVQSGVDFVAQLAKTHRAQVTVLHAYRPAPSSAFSSYFLGFGSDNASIKAKALVNNFVKRLKRMGVKRVSGEVVIGSSGEALRKTAKSLEPDLIVMNSQGNIIPMSPEPSRIELTGSRQTSAPALID